MKGVGYIELDMVKDYYEEATGFKRTLDGEGTIIF